MWCYVAEKYDMALFMGMQLPVTWVLSVWDVILKIQCTHIQYLTSCENVHFFIYPVSLQLNTTAVLHPAPLEKKSQSSLERLFSSLCRVFLGVAYDYKF